MKRILHITGKMNRAGAEMVIMNLYRFIDRTKVQFDFLYFTSKKCDFDDEIEKLGGVIYRITEVHPLKRMLATKQLLSLNKEWTTIHAHTLFSNAFHIYAAYRAGVKQRISHSHSIGDKNDNNRFINIIYHYASRIIQSKYATDFVACTTSAGKYLFPNQKNVKIIKNSIDSEYFIRIGEEKENNLRKEFNIENNTLVLLQLARLSTVKNHEFSIKIGHELKKNKIKFRLLFAGKGALLDTLKEQVKNLNLEREILFLGLRTDVPRLLAGSDLLLLPSLHEGFGLVLLEAQATGIPSLISDTIPPDSDIDVDLIYVQSLKESPEIWANRILEICEKNVTIEKEMRLLKLREFGYDNHVSVQTLIKLYNPTK